MKKNTLNEKAKKNLPLKVAEAKLWQRFL